MAVSSDPDHSQCCAMRRVLALIVLGTAVAGLSGCAKVLTADDLAGAWTGKQEISDADLVKQLKAAGKSEKDLPAAKKQAVSIPLELKKDKTFTLGSGRGMLEGNWKFEKSEVTLTLTKAGGM